MRASDVMTFGVVTVGPDDLVQDVAKKLLKHQISGAPVVDQAGKLVGIVTEGDMMRRVETGTETRRSWWLRALASQETLAIEYVRAYARKVSDVMTTNVISAAPNTPLRDIATLLERNRIKRLPIVENGKILGVVSRANLLQAFASVYIAPSSSGIADDGTIRDRVLKRLRTESWSSPSSVNIIVQKGIVELWGAVSSEAEHKAIRLVTEGTPGVTSVNDYLAVAPMTSGV